MNKLTRSIRRNQSGDTIVEVLIVLAVLSLGFAISYATSTRALSQSRNAEEHSEVLGILNAQVELLRSALAKHVVVPVGSTPAVGSSSTYFCMSDQQNPPAVVGFGSYSVPVDPKLDTAVDNGVAPNVYPAECIKNFYHTSIVYDGATGAYDLRIRWVGPGQTGPQQEEFNYKVSPAGVSFSPTPYAAGSVIPTPSAQVRVQKILSADGKNSPNCSGGNKTNLPGADVRLSNGQSSVTAADGVARFLELSDGQNYTASYSNANYGACNGGTTSVTASTTGSAASQGAISVTSICTTIPAQMSEAGSHIEYDSVTTYTPNWVYIDTVAVNWINVFPYAPVFFYLWPPDNQEFYILVNGNLAFGTLGIYWHYQNQPIPLTESVPRTVYDPPVQIKAAITTCT